MWSTIIGGLLAFGVSAVIVGIDCWRQNSREFVYSVHPSYGDWCGILFCGGSGAVGASAFAYANWDPTSWAATVVSIGFQEPIPRGAATGLSIMVLIRSKALQTSKEGGDFGIEFFYLRLRDSLLQRLRARRANDKSGFVAAQLPKALTIEDFPVLLDEHLREVLGETDRRKVYDTSQEAMVRSKPGEEFSSDNPLWKTYYRTVLRNAVDFVGIEPIRTWMERSA